MTRLTGYLRVSTGEQVEHGNGLHVPRETIDTMAAGRGTTVAASLNQAGQA